MYFIYELIFFPIQTLKCLILFNFNFSSKKKSHGSKKRSGMSVLKEDDDEEENGGGITIKASSLDNKGFSAVD